MKRALMGGTFDPPHIAHLLAADAAHAVLGVDVVTFLPAGSPWQKDDVEAATHRWEMTRRAVSGVPYFEADDREVRRPGSTYTVDTVASFSADDEIWLVLGSDAAANIRTWHRADELLERVSVAVAPRPGTATGVVEDTLGDVVWLEMPQLELSGTMIRRRVAEGRPVRFLVRESVYEYITDHGLYRSPGDRLPASDTRR